MPTISTNVLQVCSSQEYQRKLHPDDLPLRAQLQRIQKGEQCHFLVRKNPHYPRRKLSLATIIESSKSAHHSTMLSTATKEHSHTDGNPSDECSVCVRLNNNNNNTTTTNNNNNNPNSSSTSAITSSAETTEVPVTTTTTVTPRYISPYTTDSERFCKMCRNSFRSCEFCNKNVTTKLSTRLPRVTGTLMGSTTTYNPVYNIREIRSVCNSFSSMALERKIVHADRSTKALSFAGSIVTASPTSSTNSIVQEVVNNNPAKGYGNYVYI